MWLPTLGEVALTWYIAVVLVITIGTAQLFRYFLSPAPHPTSPTLPLASVPHVTVIRPVKGLEPSLYACLASTFQQTYPRSKLSIRFCIPSRSDSAFPTLSRLISDHPSFDAQILIEEEDPRLNGTNGSPESLGPNPKIRNMSASYNSARGDTVWIIDCNVWVSRSACGLMVDSLCGFAPGSRGRKYKFVHQLPLAVDISGLHPSSVSPSDTHSTNPTPTLSAPAPSKPLMDHAGGLLDELFLSTSHAKFYTAISSVAVAPCTVGKSNMFRRSHLAALTQPDSADPHARPGIDFFSHNICEDHLIGDLLWKAPLPASVQALAELEGQPESTSDDGGDDDNPSLDTPGSKSKSKSKRSWGNHFLLPCPPCIQPLESTSLRSYAARRARWLRVRKFTVPAATLVEPATESFLATALGAYGLTSVPWVYTRLGIEPTWTSFGVLWVLGVGLWGALDWVVWRVLGGWRSERLGTVEGAGKGREEVPFFVGSAVKRGFGEWLGAWLGREGLAFPVWAWAVFGGTEVSWRGRKFRVGLNMKVHAVGQDKDGMKGDKAL
ncbi:MAG: hypothetical protein MMC23_001468 [Stictis urceolatum]|nr:hypothetical protein [Stictis urceolata]